MSHPLPTQIEVSGVLLFIIAIGLIVAGIAKLTGRANPGEASDRIILQGLGFAAICFALRFLFGV